METIEVKSNELIKITNDSGLEKTKSQEYLELFTPYFNTMAEIEKKINLLNSENPTDSDVQIARTIRLSLKNNRVAAEKIKTDKKESILVEGRLIDNLYGIVKNTSQGLEKSCEAIEKHAELKEKARKAELKETRLNRIIPFEVETSFYDLENMPDDQFETLFTGIKKNHDDKIEAARIEEENRLKRIEAERIENERIKAENEKLKLEAAERERLAEIERKKQEKILQAEREKAAEEKRKSDALAEQARKETERVKKQIEAECAERERQEQIEKERIEREQKEKEELEEKRLAASDSEKFIQLANDIKSIQIPKVQSKESKQLIKQIESELENIVKRLLKNKG